MKTKKSKLKLKPVQNKVLNEYSFDSHRGTSLYNNSFLSQDLETSFNQEEYKGMMHNIPFSPGDLIKAIALECAGDLESIVINYPQLGNRTTFDLLVSIPDSILSDYPKLVQCKKRIIQVLKQMDRNFKLYLQERLHQGHHLADAHLLGIQAFLGDMGFYGELNIEEVFSEGEVPEADAQKVLYSLRLVSRLIPRSYKKNIPPVTLVIRGENPLQSAFASVKDKTILVLNLRKNMLSQLAEAFHEYMHLVEKFNPEIMTASNNFLKKRCSGKGFITLKEVKEKYNKPVLPTALDVKVLEGNFIDPYAGKIYGEFNSQDKKLVATELLSVGAEALLLNPVSFLFRDPDHFNLIKDILTAKI